MNLARNFDPIRYRPLSISAVLMTAILASEARETGDRIGLMGAGE